MCKKKPFIHLIPGNNKQYFYDVNTNTIVPIDKEIIIKLNNVMQEKGNYIADYSDAQLNNLRSMGYLSEFKVETIEHGKTELLDYLLSRHIEKITLQVTQSCNLRCSYCAYSATDSNKQRHHCNKIMDFSVAKDSVDFLIKNSLDAENVNIGFYGGEPLLAFSLIKKVVDYVNNEYYEKNISYSITTNGTILNENILDFFVKNNVNVTISLDGPAEIHNLHRIYAKTGQGSFEDIINNLQIMYDYFLSHDKKNNMGINMVIDPQNDYDVIFSLKERYPVLENVEIRSTIIEDLYLTTPISFDNKFVEKRSYDMFLCFLDSFGLVKGVPYTSYALQHLITVQSDLDMQVKTKELRTKCAPGGPCVPGQRRLFIDVDGNFYPCERVSETSKSMNIGSVKKGFDLEKCSKILNIAKLTSDDCKNCWAFNYCTICAKLADNGNELTAEQKKLHCEKVRMAADFTMRTKILFDEILEFKREVMI